MAFLMLFCYPLLAHCSAWHLCCPPTRAPLLQDRATVGHTGRVYQSGWHGVACECRSARPHVLSCEALLIEKHTNLPCIMHDAHVGMLQTIEAEEDWKQKEIRRLLDEMALDNYETLRNKMLAIGISLPSIAPSASATPAPPPPAAQEAAPAEEEAKVPLPSKSADARAGDAIVLADSKPRSQICVYVVRMCRQW